MVPTLTELATIVNGLSRHSLVSEMVHMRESGLAEVTSALPFVTSLHALRGVLTPTIRVMAQKDHLPKLTSLKTKVAYADMETHWVRRIKARQSGCSNAGIIQSVKINVADAPNLRSISKLSRKIREIQDQLKLKGAMIELVDVVSVLAQLDEQYVRLFKRRSPTLVRAAYDPLAFATSPAPMSGLSGSAPF